MKVAVVRQFNRPLVIKEVPVPSPRPGQILVRIPASGVCHTDLYAAKATGPSSQTSLYSGHEGVGHIAAVGAGVSHANRRPARPAERRLARYTKV